MTSIAERAWAMITADMAGGMQQYDYWEEVPEHVRKRYVVKLAAMAIGATEFGGGDDCRPPGVVLRNGEPVNYEGSGQFGYPWNPLEDDAEAFRLAIKLDLFAKGYPRLSPGDSDEERCASARKSVVIQAAKIGASCKS